MLYCLNPDCINPVNIDTNTYCKGCGTELIKTIKNYQLNSLSKVISTQTAKTKKITRARFLQMGGYVIGGIIVAVVVNNFLEKQNKIPALKSFSFLSVKVNLKGEIIERQHNYGQSFSVPLTKDLNLELVSILGGQFIMGSDASEVGRDRGESPQREVKVAPFYLGKYPITQQQWQAVMGNNPSYFRGDRLPVEKISWDNASRFCQKLSKLVGIKFRLPSEAEWEYACRAGSNTPFSFGETITSDLVNYKATFAYAQENLTIYRATTTEVGSFPPNAFGLYDMHGNVWEWCADHWHNDYERAPLNSKPWFYRTHNNIFNLYPLRGGSWYNPARLCRSANRSNSFGGGGGHFIGSIGLRISCDPSVSLGDFLLGKSR
jgi:formylglycine-generating enzyme required for sulfatase activity